MLCFPIFARRTVTCAGLLVMTAAPAFAQTFTKITATTNPIVTDPVSPVNFSGVSWMDYDADGRVDLFVCNVALYRNLGGGSFTKIVIPGNDNRVGVSWADVDNDGDLGERRASSGCSPVRGQTASASRDGHARGATTTPTAGSTW